MKTLYFDCFAGASGNMILGGLVSLGVDPSKLEAELKKLDIAEFSIGYDKVDRSGISAIHATVQIPDEKKHRHLSDIVEIIESSRLSDVVKRRSAAIFRRLAEAEAKIHGIDVERVHFHEVGALDAIIDVVGSCIGFEILEIDDFACSNIHVGSGFVNIEHGKFPVPPPAVTELLTNVPIYSTEIVGELITPTGAAIISSLCSSYGQIPEMFVEKSGYGAGSREYAGFPNALRLILGVRSQVNTAERQKVVVLESNIDDESPQTLGFVMERAFDLGALDCWFTPIHMKKNRPAVMLSILCTHAEADELTAMIYSETTTLGVRMAETERECLDREIIRSRTPYGDVDVKIARRGGAIVNVMPEYDQVKAIANEQGLPFRVIRESAIANAADTASVGR